MTDSPRLATPYLILAATDFSPLAELAVQQAWRLATQRPDARLHVAHVVDLAAFAHSAGAFNSQIPSLRELPSRLLTHAVRCAHGAELPWPQDGVGIHVRIGSPAQELQQLTAELDASLLVIGGNGRSRSHPHLGSVSRRLLERCPLSVLVSRPKPRLEERLGEPLPPTQEVAMALPIAQARRSARIVEASSD